jgi:hypothetical protein
MFAFTKGQANEDRLTAAVFGLMRYLAAPEYLHPFLELLSRRTGYPTVRDGFAWDPDRLPDDHRLDAWPTFRVPREWGARFSPRDGARKGTVEPDASILLQWDRWGLGQSSRRVRIWVESEHSKVVEAEQLAQQWAVLHNLPQEHAGPEATAAEERWLLLVNSTPMLPWPDAALPGATPIDGSRGRDLQSWCAHRVQHLRTGEHGLQDADLAPSAWPRLLHVSWQQIARLALALERRSWAYSSLFGGLRGYLADAGYHPPVRFLDVVKHAPSKPIEDRAVRIGLARPSLLNTAPSAIPETAHE